MTIKEIEERSGLQRANIRFYEQEGLISPGARATATVNTAKKTSVSSSEFCCCEHWV